MNKESTASSIKSCFQKIRAVYGTMSSTEKSIASYILENPEKTVSSSTEEMSMVCGTSQASIIRFGKILGYTGFKEMKIRMAQELGSMVPGIIADTETVRKLDFVKELLESSIQALQKTSYSVDNTMLDSAIDAISGASQVDIYGAGESGIVGEDLHLKLKRLGIPGSIYSNPHLQAISAAALKPGDVAVGISFSGCTGNTIDAIDLAAKAGATTIAITNFSDFPLGEHADIILETDAGEPLLPYGSASSRIAQHFVVDLIFIRLLLKYSDKYKTRYEQYNKIIQDRL